MNVVEFPTEDPPAGFMIGPFNEYRVVIEGRCIPQLTAVREGDQITLILDGRFSISVPKDRAYQIAWMVANALAVGEGYACLSSENKNKPFAPLSFGIERGSGR